ncbi:nonribosomal peptide synthetase [Ceratobasidium sp. AG-Ba]|nr:nonribosomal peptide synthetase [Ceratobasidium sp. AG-Ba]QRV91780.1 nonribosomal peptide synthetase [Ceratobasidium sp. AG-Ba]
MSTLPVSITLPPTAQGGSAFTSGQNSLNGSTTDLEKTGDINEKSLEGAIAADIAVLKQEEERDYHHQNKYVNGTMIWAHQIWWIIVAIINIPVYIYMANNEHKEKIVDWIAHAAVINLTIVILVRNELLLGAAYYSFNYIPFRRFYFHRMLHSIGGLHVGGSFAALIWITTYVAELGKHTPLDTAMNRALFVTALLLPIGIVVMMFFALRPLRERFHNAWEYTHRFVGWALVLDLIAHLGVKAATLPKARDLFIHGALPYLTIVITISIFYVWFTVTKPKVDIFANKSVAIIKFPGKPTIADGTFARISRNWWQWHAFSVAFSDNTNPDKPRFALIVGKAGDWTNGLIGDSTSGNAPERLFIRGVNPPGFMHMHHAYKRVVTICTGAGIAPALPHIRQHTSNIHLIWIGKNHRETYGEEVWASVVDNLPADQIQLHDTGKQGRPDIKDLIIKAGKKHQAEAVFIVSNDPYTLLVMNICWRIGIRCYGATRDS